MNEFIESIKTTENEETKLLELQEKYQKGIIKEKDLTNEQRIALINLYTKQINELKKSNEIRKNKLLEYKEKNRRTKCLQ